MFEKLPELQEAVVDAHGAVDSALTVAETTHKVSKLYGPKSKATTSLYELVKALRQAKKRTETASIIVSGEAGE